MTQWISRAGWARVHALAPNGPWTHLGVDYYKTYCGRRVRGVGLTDDRPDNGDRCPRCVTAVSSNLILGRR